MVEKGVVHIGNHWKVRNPWMRDPKDVQDNRVVTMYRMSTDRLEMKDFILNKQKIWLTDELHGNCQFQNSLKLQFCSNQTPLSHYVK